MDSDNSQHPSYRDLAEQLRRIEELLVRLTDALLQVPSKDEILTASEASSFLKIPQDTLYKLTSQKRIPYFKAGKQLRFSRSVLLHHLYYSKIIK